MTIDFSVILPRPKEWGETIERVEREYGQIEKEREETGTFFRFGRYLSLRKGKEEKSGVRAATGVWEDNADREKTEQSTLKVRARAWLQPTFPTLWKRRPGDSFSRCTDETGPSKGVSQRGGLVCGSCANPNAYEGKGGREGEREGWLIRVDCGSAKAARFPGWSAGCLAKAANAKNKNWLTRYADRARTNYSIKKKMHA